MSGAKPFNPNPNPNPSRSRLDLAYLRLSTIPTFQHFSIPSYKYFKLNLHL